jgi:osmotically-inducible protein OsmY
MAHVNSQKGAYMTLRSRTLLGSQLATLVLLTVAICVGVACNSAHRSNSDYKANVKTALEQADLKDVTVSEDAAKNTITLGGTLHTEDAKNRAASVAQTNAGPRIIANEISVEPVGNERDARKIESNVDDGIESNFKAELISKGLDKQHIRYDAKNGVLTIKGSVQNVDQRKEAQELAKNTPNVQQVVNEIRVER